ncbi:MAG: response regulator transcription factor [Cytophagales bacterium]|nr:response regulator transcription factor [bacterium]NJM94867.1 response regulator transcription factor [Cytophagales bacterium]
MSLTCMVVDDDELSRNVVNHYIKKTSFLSLTHECTNAIDASNILKDENIDVIYLDIEMPEMSGMDLIKTLDGNNEVILITSNIKYAVEAFEVSVTDYLVKPFDYTRFLQASTKAKERIDAFRRKNEQQIEIYVKSDSRLVRLNLKDILFVEALADYVIINTGKSKLIVHSTMKGIEKRLPASYFARIHRSFIINTERIDYLEDNAIIINDKIMPIGASYRDNFMSRLNLL